MVEMGRNPDVWAPLLFGAEILHIADAHVISGNYKWSPFNISLHCICTKSFRCHTWVCPKNRHRPFQWCNFAWWIYPFWRHLQTDSLAAIGSPWGVQRAYVKRLGYNSRNALIGLSSRKILKNLFPCRGPKRVRVACACFFSSFLLNQCSDWWIEV